MLSEKIEIEFHCEKCGVRYTKVYPTKGSAEAAKKRRRFCDKCGKENAKMRKEMLREQKRVIHSINKKNVDKQIEETVSCKEINKACDKAMKKRGIDIRSENFVNGVIVEIPVNQKAVQYGEDAAARYMRRSKMSKAETAIKKQDSVRLIDANRLIKVIEENLSKVMPAAEIMIQVIEVAPTVEMPIICHSCGMGLGK